VVCTEVEKFLNPSLLPAASFMERCISSRIKVYRYIRYINSIIITGVWERLNTPIISDMVVDKLNRYKQLIAPNALDKTSAARNWAGRLTVKYP
jgi:hypothetical protein